MSPARSSSPEATAGAPGVGALDALAERLLAAAPHLRVAPVASGPEREALFRLRRRHVVERGWARPEDLTGGLERDRYDEDAVHVAAYDADVLVGTVRLVLPSPGCRLPVEADFGLDVEPRGAVVEAGRLVVADAYRGDPAHRAWGALFGRAWLETRAAGYRVLAGAASPGMVARLRALGLPFEILGPTRRHWNQDHHPVRLDPATGDHPGWYGDGAPPLTAPA